MQFARVLVLSYEEARDMVLDWWRDTLVNDPANLRDLLESGGLKTGVPDFNDRAKVIDLFGELDIGEQAIANASNFLNYDRGVTPEMINQVLIKDGEILHLVWDRENKVPEEYRTQADVELDNQAPSEAMKLVMADRTKEVNDSWHVPRVRY